MSSLFTYISSCRNKISLVKSKSLDRYPYLSTLYRVFTLVLSSLSFLYLVFFLYFLFREENFSRPPVVSYPTHNCDFLPYRGTSISSRKHLNTSELIAEGQRLRSLLVLGIIGSKEEEIVESINSIIAEVVNREGNTHSITKKQAYYLGLITYSHLINTSSNTSNVERDKQVIEGKKGYECLWRRETSFLSMKGDK